MIARQRLWWALGAVFSLLWVGFVAATYRFGWSATGFLNKSLWDWLQLLIIPSALAFGGFWFSQVQKNSEQRIASDNQRAAILQTYLDHMSELLLEKDLRESIRGDEVRNVARAQTMTVLGSLDADRKRSVVLFLYESGLLHKDQRIVDLRTAALRSADEYAADVGATTLSEAGLHVADLSGADLGAANLRDANLNGVYLQAADLSGADLSAANLSRANLREADLGATILRNANLNRANLWNADLSNVDLRGADLHGANLRGVDLSGADLSGTKVPEEQLKKATSLQGATMPDGSKHA